MSIYPAGQCTDYVANTLSWISSAGNLGNALSWASAWRAKGGVVSSTPTPGTVAVFQPGAGGALGTGHVAVVQSVQPDGTFTVSEQNFESGPGTGLGKTDLRSGIRPGFGISFLYPASGTSSGTTGLSSLTPGLGVAPAGLDLSGVPIIGPALGGILGWLEVGLGAAMALIGVYLFSKDTAVGRAVAAPVKAVTPTPVKAVKQVKATRQRKERETTRRHDADIAGQERKYVAEQRTQAEASKTERENARLERQKMIRAERSRQQRAITRAKRAGEKRQAQTLTEVPF